MDVDRLLDLWPGSTCAVAVVRDHGDVQVWQRGEPGATFAWASVTKPLASLAMLASVNLGTVALDDAAGPPSSTLRHLLSHASGLAFDSPAVLSAPGMRRIYSNTGIDVAADYVSGEEGVPVEALVMRVTSSLGMSGFQLRGPASHGGHGTIDDLARLGAELLSPKLISAELHEAARTVQFPGLAGILPGFGRRDPNDWGLGWEIRGHKTPHWTSPDNSPRTYGHFGQSGSMVWVDPDARVCCVSLSDTPFGPWAADVWPRLSTLVLGKSD